MPYWRYSAFGGAVYCGQNSEPEFINCFFQGNRAIGGASGISGAAVSQPEFHFRIDRFGGAVFVASQSKAYFDGCVFVDNVADPNTPATHHDGEETQLYDPYVGYGGAVAYDSDADPTFKNCIWEENFANIGGAVYAQNAKGKIYDCNIVDNRAYHGAGVYFVNSNLDVQKSTFIRNDSSYEQAEGGGLYAFRSPGTIQDNVFRKNTAEGTGGAAYIAGDETIEFKNNLVIENTSGSAGAGIATVWYSKPTISNTTIVGNDSNSRWGDANEPLTYGGGLYTAFYSYAKLKDSILWDNQASRGKQISLGAGFYFDPPQYSTLDIEYSDIQFGRPQVFLADELAALNWLEGNIDQDPLFVDGPEDFGSYYLSQYTAGQNQKSPAVNAGSDLSSKLDMHLYTTRTDEVPDFDTVDMGYHYRRQELVQPKVCAKCDLVKDGIIDIDDIGPFAAFWLNDDCQFGEPYNDPQRDNWCSYRDFNYDNTVDIRDLAYLFNCMFEEDEELPTPNPSRWATAGEPAAESSDSQNLKIVMTAEQTYDDWDSQVEYYFDCVNENLPGCDDSGWITENQYTDEQLFDGTQYTYRVKARDNRGSTGETEWSSQEYAIAGTDGNPPLPNPSQWDVPPYSGSQTSVRMKAQDAADPEGNDVEYYFDCVLGECHDSGWLSESEYEDFGLTLGLSYTYTVKTRDLSNNLNEGIPSEEATVQLGSELLTVVWNQQPTISQCGAFTMSIIGNDPAYEDAELEYYFECVDGECNDSGWQPEDTYTDTDLETDAENTYTYRAKVRNQAVPYRMSMWTEEVQVDFVGVDCLPPSFGGDTPYKAYFAEARHQEVSPGVWYDTLIAAAATDENGVLYKFDCSGSCTEATSGWQTSNTYTVQSTLNPDRYYTVTAKDGLENIGIESDPVDP
jgi:hypothetical protein